MEENSEPPPVPQEVRDRAMVERLKAELKPLVRERRLTMEALPELLGFATLLANDDPTLREHFASVEEMLQLWVRGTPPERLLWIRIERGHFTTGQGKVEQTIAMEFKDDKTMLGVFSATINPQVAVLTGKLKITPLARAMVFAEFFNVLNKNLE